MLLLDRNNHPVNTVYYLAAQLHALLTEYGELDYAELHKITTLSVSPQKISDQIFSLALDFLFLLGKVSLNERGDIYVY